VIAVHRRVHEAHQPIPPIQQVLDVDQNGLTIGASPLECYEALFGYRLEHFPKGALTSGSALARVGDRLNIKDPACYVFPTANHCRPGDHFTAERREQAAAFLHYRPYPFRQPLAQRITDTVNLFAVFGLAGFFVAYLVVVARLRRAPGSRQQSAQSHASKPRLRKI
jgi:hypothetical protein